MTRIVEAVRKGVLDEKILNRGLPQTFEINSRYVENAQPETIWDKIPIISSVAQLAEDVSCF